MPPNPGYGDCFEEPRTMFYFDSMDLKCKKFKVINCFGKNQNQFETYELCTRFCQSTACLAGQSLLLARDSSPVNCKEAGCPTGYRCVYDKLFNRHVCCGHSPTGVCPIGSVSFSHVRSNQPMRCNPSAYRDLCPADYVCTTQGLHSFCCSPHDAICPAGQQPYNHIVSKNSMKCNPLETSSCPETYYCSPAVPGAHWGFCCSVHIEASCPSETEPYLDFMSKTPVRCTVGVTQCNIGYSCQSSQSGSLIGFCCTIPKLTYRTPSRSSSLNENSSESVSQFITPTDQHFFIHNEGLIGPAVKPRTSSILSSHQKSAKKYQKVTKSTSTYGVVSNYKPATCPPRATSVFYANTQINVECTPAEGYSFDCPDNSTCVDAYTDLAGRRVCCQMPKTTATPTFVYFVTSTPRMVRYKTTDSYCPYAIRHLQCRPSASTCPMGYFCQYLFEISSFSCCSLY
ncbi:hypothetical protein GCK72_023576 [Caenorhabditis remanei]|uniref:BPTI/Kunitz inhibitor domain-containing protein n=1 Tax=Caenorhabditis remanei TaxID=31234 RepID=A0A6A5FX79_CAERE|nr:hypothetical protein GCK72_023576 [Caenorhabditis remanei]KAF1747117.1 hypothetical protein GCK72_023576 [Caenorhabditis remanei]